MLRCTQSSKYLSFTLLTPLPAIVPACPHLPDILDQVSSDRIVTLQSFNQVMFSLSSPILSPATVPAHLHTQVHRQRGAMCHSVWRVHRDHSPVS